MSVTTAHIIRDLRKHAGLSQAQLAQLVGTKQSVISRLEDPNYDKMTVSMLRRIARALDRRVHICFRKG